MLKRVAFLIPIIVVFFALGANTVRAQEADSTVAENSFAHTWLYHFLFDSVLTSKVPVVTDSERVDQISHFAGNLTDIDISNNAFNGEIDDTLSRARFVNIRCSDKPEYAEIDRFGEDSLNVAVYQRDPGTGSKRGEPIFSHSFFGNKTCEVRLHLNGGDDYAIVRGSVASSISLYVIGGEGNDELVDSSRVSGYLLHFLPISKDEKKTFFYGEPNETNFIYSSSTVVSSKRTASDDSTTSTPTIRNWGHAWHYSPWLGYTTDDGAFIGAGVSLIQYGFREDPYSTLMTLRGGYATNSHHYRVEHDVLFPNALSGLFSLNARASSMDILNFFGFGNESDLNRINYDALKYRVEQQSFSISPKYTRSIFENTVFWVALAGQYINIDSNAARDTTFLRRRHDYGVGSMSSLKLSYGVKFDSRDVVQAPSKGILASFESSWTPEVLDNKFAYTKLKADIRGYLSAKIGLPITLALRMRAEKIFGEAPFYESSFLGGSENLRGFYRERFAGVSSSLGSADLRIEIGSYNILTPGTFGLLLFSDVGRVNVDNDFSNKWYTSFGGGLWIAPISKEHTIVLSVGHSSEATQLSLGSGFAF